MTKIKICDIRDMDDAILCQDVNVDFIGIHQIHAPLSQEKIKFIESLSKYNYEYKVVLVTKETNINEIVNMLDMFHWDYIQLHYLVEYESLIELFNIIKNKKYNVGIIMVMEIGQINKDIIERYSPYCDYFLFDKSYQGGTGELAQISKINELREIKLDRSFIAGGLNCLNVKSIINDLHPFAVDVQSGVESIKFKHKKDRDELIKFVNAVRLSDNSL